MTDTPKVDLPRTRLGVWLRRQPRMLIIALIAIFCFATLALCAYAMTASFGSGMIVVWILCGVVSAFMCLLLLGLLGAHGGVIAVFMLSYVVAVAVAPFGIQHFILDTDGETTKATVVEVRKVFGGKNGPKFGCVLQRDNGSQIPRLLTNGCHENAQGESALVVEDPSNRVSPLQKEDVEDSNWQLWIMGTALVVLTGSIVVGATRRQAL